MPNLTTEQILRRYEIAERNNGKSNCRGTGLYLLGLLGRDCYIHYMNRDHLSQSLDLEPSPEIVDRGLVVFFGGLYSTRVSQEVGHVGVSLDIDGEWRILHRDGHMGELYNDLITDPTSTIYQNFVSRSEPPILKNKSLLEQLPNERVSFFKIKRDLDSKRCGIVNVLAYEGIRPRIK